ncbi:HigA family addiction module antidote protein [Candidatus Kaiserbacteria bacterium]|nr:HigA family addiction module antidote protein [Candidatus Kaiserbacteria bacterium]
MVETKLSYNPDFAIHPGETLREELDLASISQVELVQRTGLSEKHISQIINGEASVTPDTAIKLERSLGIAAEFWANLQKNYDVTVARIESEKRLAKEIDESRKFKCYEELVSVGCIKPAQDLKEKAENLLNFFAVDSLAYLPQTEAIAFRQTRGKFDERSLAAWLRCGEIEASRLQVGPFNKMRVREIIPEIKKLTLLPEGFGRKLQTLCATAGIAVVFSPYFKKTRVSGSTRWIGDKAVIQINTKGAYSDIFWFTFFHELGHVMLHGVKERFLEFEGKTKDEKEREADEFAAKNLIPESEYGTYIRSGKLDRVTAERFARSVGIDASIVLGRLAYDGFAQWRQIAHDRPRLMIRP